MIRADPVPATPRRRGGVMAVLVRVTAAFLILVSTLAVRIPAYAANTSVNVDLTSAVITGQGTEAVLNLAGTVTNTGTATLYTVQVLTWRDVTPVISRAQLATVLAASPTAATGARLTTPASFQSITGSPKPWQPGATASFSVTAKITDLGLTATGVYLVGVQVRAAIDMSASYVTVGRARTLVTFGTPASTAATTSIVMLNSAPSFLSAGLLADDHLAAELGGRLLTLVRHAQQPGVTYAIDPLLYREVSTMANGYEVGTATTHAPGAGQAAAAVWLAEFAKLSGGYRLPYGSPDLALVAATHDTTTLGLTDQATALVTQVAGLPLLVAAANYEADQRFLDTVAALKPAVVLAETRAAGQTLSSAAGKVVSVDPGAFSGGPGPDSATTDLQYAARLRAESFLAAMNPAEGNARVVATELQAALDSTTNPWESRVPISALRLSATPWSPAVSGGSQVAVRGTSLEAAIANGSARIAAFTSLAGDPVSGDGLRAQYLPLVLSTSWQTDEQARAFLTTALDPYGVGGSAITISVAAHVVMTSRNTQFPVTVSNTLSYPVRVKVTVSTSNENRLSVPASQLVAIDPGESVTVNVSPKATANGSVDALVQLVTEAGNPVGTPQQFVIEATETGRVAWVIVIASGLVLAAMTVLRIRQVARAPRRREGA